MDRDRKPVSRWRLVIWRIGVFMENNALVVSAAVVFTPFAILQMIAYSRGYSGWIPMVTNWLTGG